MNHHMRAQRPDTTDIAWIRACNAALVLNY
ncbi:hypothetical protein AOG1_21770 [Geobacter sp. AOG1]|nr:hypothetical protein AOG1_21770 [Geobacter sp. AOG1]